MSIGKGTHWKGPTLGSDLAGDGLYEDYPIGLMSNQEVFSWKTDFLDVNGTTNAAATVFASHWTNEFIVAGTSTVAAGTANPLMSLTHGVAAQGPFIRWSNATAGVGGAGARGNTITTLNNPASYLFECGASFQASSTRDDAYIGYVTNVANPPLTAGPPSAIDVANQSDGVGFFWNNAGAGTGRPSLVCWRGGALQTLVNAPTNLIANVDGTQNYYGVRVDLTTGGTTIASWYVNRRRVFRHSLSAAFSVRMTFGAQLVARGAAAQFNLTRVLLARRSDTSTIFPPPA